MAEIFVHEVPTLNTVHAGAIKVEVVIVVSHYGHLQGVQL